MESHRNPLFRLATYQRWEVVLVALLILEIGVFGLINPRFLTVASLVYSTSDFAQIGIVAIPLTLVIIAGGIDVSFSSAIGLCAIVFGIANFYGLPLVASITVALGVGALCGLFNAVIISVSRIQPLIVTLGSLYFFSGIATVLSGTVGASGYEGIGGFPDSFANFAGSMILGLPAPFAVMMIEAFAIGFLLHKSNFGRLVFLCGMSEVTSRYSGIKIARTQAWTYILTGLAAAVAGLVLSSYFGSARTDLGTTTLLSAVTAVALGGASVYGGQGTIFGTVLGTLLIGYLQQGLQMSGISSQVSSALAGALLVVAVSIRQMGPVLRSLFAVLKAPEQSA